MKKETKDLLGFEPKLIKLEFIIYLPKLKVKHHLVVQFLILFFLARTRTYVCRGLRPLDLSAGNTISSKWSPFRASPDKLFKKSLIKINKTVRG